MNYLIVFEHHLNIHVSLLHGFDCLFHTSASFCDLILIENNLGGVSNLWELEEFT